MPNQSNIISPISLIAFGRSGTTLLQNVFAHLPQMSIVGETADLIFGCWDAVRRSIPITTPKYKGDKIVSEEELTSEAIRNVFLYMFPDSLDLWFQKPIGIPRVLQLDYWNNDWEEAAEIYWPVMTTAFPQAKFFTILRHPCDVVLSSKSYWGWPEAGIWRGLAFMATILASPFSQIGHVVLFDDLINDPKNCLQDLFNYLEIDYSKNVLKAFDTIHSPSNESKAEKKFSPSRKDEWKTLDPISAPPSFFSAIQKAYEKFKYDFELPPQILAELAEKKETADKGKPSTTPEARIKKLAQNNRYLTKQIRKLHTNHGLEIKRITAEYEQKILDLQKKNKKD